MPRKIHDYLTRSEIAELLRCHPDTVTRHVHAGRLPPPVFALHVYERQRFELWKRFGPEEGERLWKQGHGDPTEQPPLEETPHD